MEIVIINKVKNKSHLEIGGFYVGEIKMHLEKDGLLIRNALISDAEKLC